VDYPLKYLTLDDRALITEASTRVWFGHNDVVIQQGQTRPALMTVCAGVARVEVDGVPISLLGAGAIVGEMSFVGNTTASATVIADTYLGVDVIEGEFLHNLIASVPGFASRFYNSIALLLSHRLKQSTRLSVSAMSASQRYTGRERLTGQLPASDLPAHVIELARRYRRSLEELLEDYHSLEGVPPREAESRVRDICDELHAAVTDLSQLEEPESQGIRGHLYREGFPFFMRSRVHDCAHTRPLGVSMDVLMLRSIRRARARRRWAARRPHRPVGPRPPFHGIASLPRQTIDPHRSRAYKRLEGKDPDADHLRWDRD